MEWTCFILPSNRLTLVALWRKQRGVRSRSRETSLEASAVIQVKDGLGDSDGGGQQRSGPGYILKYSQQDVWRWDVRGRRESRQRCNLWCEHLEEWNCH